MNDKTQEYCFDDGADWYLGALTNKFSGAQGASTTSWWDGSKMHIRVYVLSDQGFIQELCWDGSTWYSGALTGKHLAATSAPAAVSWVDGAGNPHVRVYAQSSAKKIQELCWDGDAWYVGGLSGKYATESAPTVTAWSSQGKIHIRVYVLAADKKLNEYCWDNDKWYRGALSGHYQAAGAPAATSWLDGQGQAHIRLYMATAAGSYQELCWDKDDWYVGSFRGNGAEWTVMVFLNADNNLEPFGLADFKEMSQIAGNERVNVVVQFDRNGSFATTDPQWKGTLRFNVKQGCQPLPAFAVEDIGEANMGDGSTLAEFVRWARAHYPAQRTMLVIWNHGQGWRLAEAEAVSGDEPTRQAHLKFRSAQRAREEERRAARLGQSAERAGAPASRHTSSESLPIDRVVAGGVRYVSVDDTNRDKLYNREIQDSLAALLGGERIDVIGFDACLMGMVETGYALRDVAHVMVASEELEPGAGWDYTNLLKRLSANPTMSASELGKLLVDSYRLAYGADGDRTMSAVELSAMNGLANSIDGLADAMRAQLATEKSNIRTARSKCEEYAPGYGLHGIDLMRFCEQLKLSTQNSSLRSHADDVITRLRQCVLDCYAGSERQGQFGSHGLSIYFPSSRALFDADPDHAGYLKTNTTFPVEFVQAHRWADFLTSYLT